MSLPESLMYHPKLELCPGPKAPDRYIVIFTENATPHDKRHALPPNSLSKFTFFDNPESFFLNACAGSISKQALGEVLASPYVKLVCEDGLLNTQDIQLDAPWGISRLSKLDKLGGSNALKSAFDYRYLRPAVHDVFVYVVDTGIDSDHDELKGKVVPIIGSKDIQQDTHGHGTHCAGTIAGTRFGVAKECKLVSVRVMDGSGSCLQSQLISALDAVRHDVEQRVYRHFIPAADGAVVNLSLGSPYSTAVDEAVGKLINMGVHVVAAACNQDNDVLYYSPARVHSVITVGASTFTDSRAWFSNKGALADIYAPGVFITSATYNPNHANDTEVKSGTSQACAHVSGLVAYLLGVEGYKSPSAMKKHIIELSVKDALTDIPIGSNNRLANFARLEAMI